MDFKRNSDAISLEDFVAFANGGNVSYILVGVDEQRSNTGPHKVVIVGCDISDSAILQITNKALSCIPPISIEIVPENLDGKSILKVIIPKSEILPHCTPKGIYCRRDGSRNRPIHPNELLKIFLENEGRIFAERFQESVETLSDNLNNLETSLQSSIDSMANQLGWADSQLGDTESMISSVYSTVRHISEQSKDTSKRLKALFKQDSREDPVKEAAKKELIEALAKEFLQKPELVSSCRKGGKLQVKASGKAASELDQSDIENAVNEAINLVLKSSKDELNRRKSEVAAKTKANHKKPATKRRKLQ